MLTDSHCAHLHIQDSFQSAIKLYSYNLSQALELANVLSNQKGSKSNSFHCAKLLSM